jgi:hypothetical protein
MRIRRHLSYANVAASLALVIAIAGGTTAIATKSTAPKNSVTSKSIRPFNVTAGDISRIFTVTGRADFNDPAPPDGATSGATAEAKCPAGSRLISGGGSTSDSRAPIRASTPGPGSWSVSADGDGTNQTTVLVVALCLSKKPQKPGF